MSNIGREVIISAKQGVVVGEEAGKRGKTLLTIRMADGIERKVENNKFVEFRDVPKFAPPESWDSIMNDVRRERLQRRRESIYYQNRSLADR